MSRGEGKERVKCSAIDSVYSTIFFNSLTRIPELIRAHLKEIDFLLTIFFKVFLRS